MLNVNPMASEAYYLDYARKLHVGDPEPRRAEGFTYYTENPFARDRQEPAGHFQGTLCADFGLQPGHPIDEAVFRQLYAGFAPDGSPLVQNAGSTERAAGVDITFSQNKYVSLLYMALDDAGQQALLAAHQSINAEIMRRMESEVLAQTRMQVDGYTQNANAEGVIVASFTHYETREVDLAQNLIVQKVGQDRPEVLAELTGQQVALPMLHTHNLLLNITRGPDGRYRTLDLHGKLTKPVLLKYDYLAKAMMADFLRAQGYAISADKDDFKIAGISRDLVDFASQRRTEILAQVALEGVSDDLAALSTRKGKTRLSFDGWKTQWRALTEALGLSPDFRQPPEPEAEFNPLTTCLANLLEKNIYFSTTEVEIELLKLRQFQKFDVAEVQAEIMQSPDLIAVTKDKSGLVYYSTHAHYQAEQAAEKLCQELVTTDTHHLSQIDNLIRSRAERLQAELTAEQRLMVDAICNDTSSLNLVEALAGCGKTFSNGFITEVFEQNGYLAFGLAPTNAARRQLAKDTGMPVFTLDRLALVADKLAENAAKPTPGLQQFLSHPKNAPVVTLLTAIQQGRKVFLNIDEAGMMNQKQYARLLSLIAPHRATVKLVMTGDSNQLASVAAGIPFKRLIERRMAPLAQMVNVFRQRNAADRNAAELLGTAYSVEKVMVAGGGGYQVALNGYVTNESGTLSKTGEVATRTNLLSEQRFASQEDGYAFVNSLLLGNPDQRPDYFLQFREEDGQYRIQDLSFLREADAKHFLAAYADLIAQDRYDRALQHYAAQGQITSRDCPETCLNLLAEDYLADEQPAQQKLILATRNADVDAINNRIRQRLVAAGKVEEGFLFRTTSGVARFGKGDRVVFTAEKGELHKAEFGTILAIHYQDKHRFTIQILTDSNEVRTLSPEDLGEEMPIKKGYACTVHFSQGASRQSVYFYDSDFRSAELGYVALTRHKERFRLYTTTDNLSTLAERMNKKVAKFALLDFHIESIPSRLNLPRGLWRKIQRLRNPIRWLSTLMGRQWRREERLQLAEPAGVVPPILGLTPVSLKTLELTDAKRAAIRSRLLRRRRRDRHGNHPVRLDFKLKKDGAVPLGGKKDELLDKQCKTILPRLRGG